MQICLLHYEMVIIQVKMYKGIIIGKGLTIHFSP